jgi:hypothetical protein
MNREEDFNKHMKFKNYSMDNTISSKVLTKHFNTNLK